MFYIPFLSFLCWNEFLSIFRLCAIPRAVQARFRPAGSISLEGSPQGAFSSHRHLDSALRASSRLRRSPHTSKNRQSVLRASTTPACRFSSVRCSVLSILWGEFVDFITTQHGAVLAAILGTGIAAAAFADAAFHPKLQRCVYLGFLKAHFR